MFLPEGTPISISAASATRPKPAGHSVTAVTRAGSFSDQMIDHDGFDPNDGWTSDDERESRRPRPARTKVTSVRMPPRNFNGAASASAARNSSSGVCHTNMLRSVMLMSIMLRTLIADRSFQSKKTQEGVVTRNVDKTNSGMFVRGLF